MLRKYVSFAALAGALSLAVWVVGCAANGDQTASSDEDMYRDAQTARAIEYSGSEQQSNRPPD